VLEKSGTWISFGGERLGQGRENARLFLRENTDIRDKIEATLRKQLGLAGSTNHNAATAAVEPAKDSTPAAKEHAKELAKTATPSAPPPQMAKAKAAR